MLVDVKRTQIYLDERQARELAKRAAARHTTKSELIREALDAYLAEGEGDAEVLQRFRDAVDAVAGIAPYLPDGATYTGTSRAGDVRRQDELRERSRG